MGERRGTKALELWCRRMTDGYPGVKIDNMTTSWRDGLAFCAMIHHFRPDLIDFEKLNKNDIYYNNDLAFRTAERHLGIPALLDADDMASYQVPDRLSILTYLSQFYQVFASQADSSNRINNKRTTQVTDKTTIPKAPVPPPKMANIAGVPKRDPCHKCSLPVFLAERLTIGKRVYHRTCLKCARCNYQLSPGSFYETETDEEYCCETCPDEEKHINRTKSPIVKRNSIADRLAFFENDNKKVLQKSLSDEEKSKNLKVLNDAPKNIYRHNNSLNNFINQHFEEKSATITNSLEEKLLQNSSRRTSKSSEVNSIDDSFDISEEQQSIPSKLPENSPSKHIDETDINQKLKNILKKSPSLENFNKNINTIKQDNFNTINCDTKKLEQDSSIHSLTTENFDDVNLSINVTKDNIEHDDQIKTNNKVIEYANNENRNNNSLNDNYKNMVHDRLNQFELISRNCLSNDKDINKFKYSKNTISLSDNNINYDIEVPTAAGQQTKKLEESNLDVSYHNKLTGNIQDLIENDGNSNFQTDISNEILNKNSTSPQKLLNITNPEDYPEDLNPFKSDDENDDIPIEKTSKNDNSNPFDSCSNDENNLNQHKQKIVKPPRPPPPKPISKNPFGSESEDENESIVSDVSKKTPIPTPRNNLLTSITTPEPVPRSSHNSCNRNSMNSGSYYGSYASLTTTTLDRHSDIRSSLNSITSSGGGKQKRYNKKSPAPKPPQIAASSENNLSKLTNKTARELFSTCMDNSKISSPDNSQLSTPKTRKKRPAPRPPSEIQLNTSKTIDDDISKELDIESIKIEDSLIVEKSNDTKNIETTPPKQRLITLDTSLLNDIELNNDPNIHDNENIIYRRKILIDTPFKKMENLSLQYEHYENESHDRQLEKLKDNKEANNRNRQSQLSITNDNEDNYPFYNKSIQGKWKRRKGPAPALPIPAKRVPKMLPLQDIRHELEIIEVQQQGLEKQGVIIEKMIRERCEGDDNLNQKTDNTSINTTSVNTKEVEDLILQLFELVNEKNELFRRQAELMYLRRQHRLEQEQADLEYEIRVLMAQPECNKTDSDKTKEEQLISRLMDVVRLRNEVIDCLEMDRLREAEEDMSIKQRLEMHTAKRDEELGKQTPTKLSKKEKKNQKESKKLGKNKKLDADKDADESEISMEIQKVKKKKKKFLF